MRARPRYSVTGPLRAEVETTYQMVAAAALLEALLTVHRDALGVVSKEVVQPCDRGGSVDAGVGSVVVVVVQPGVDRLAALGRAGVGPGVGPSRKAVWMKRSALPLVLGVKA